MNDLKDIFIDDPELLRVLEMKKQTKLLQQLTDNKITVITEKGDKGDTPIKGVDYFTPEDIEIIKDGIKEEVTPIKGVDYFDGVDADPNTIINSIIPRIPTKEDILATIHIPKIDENKLIDSVLKQIPPLEIPTVDEVTDNVVKQIKKKKLLEKRDIKDMPLNMNDQRWHGGGLSSVIHDSTLTGDGTTTSPLSVVGSNTGYQQPTGTVNGINNIFTFVTAPNVVVVDNVPKQKVQSDGTINWTGTSVITLAVAPNFDIFSTA